MFTRCVTVALACWLLPGAAWAQAPSWTLTNHTGNTYKDELVRLGLQPPSPFNADQVVVEEDGRPVPCQVVVLEGTRQAATKAEIWVAASLAPKESRTYQVKAGPPAAAEPKVKLARDGDALVLDNGQLAIKLPAAARAGGPILGLKPAGGAWIGQSAWQALAGATVTSEGEVISAGPLFVHVRVTSRDAATPIAVLDIRLAPGQPFATVHEKLSGGAEHPYWVLDLAHGWQPSESLFRKFFHATGKLENPSWSGGKLLTLPLAPNERLGTTLMYLQPRWTQSGDAGWFYSAADAQTLAGAIVARAGLWVWPYDNLIEVLTDTPPATGTPSADAGRKAALKLPARHGARYWLLLAGPRDLAEQAPQLVRLAAWESLDKLTHDYVLDLPGAAPGGFSGLNLYDDSQMNPTGPIRGMSRRLLADIQAGKPPKMDRGLLASVQQRFDPDTFGFYVNHWSTINPNFASDFWKVPILQTVGLKGHPQFERFRKMAEDAMRSDVEHSITLPGGAGNECPGYGVHGHGAWASLAPVCKQYLGFDPTTWPRYRAAIEFVIKTSQPLGGGQRRILPTGDTHPPGVDIARLAADTGVKVDFTTLQSEEFPGYGAMLRSRSGKPDENFLAFKAGPNRGHYHGDQLSIHYCGAGRQLAVDHMCSYAPRAEQEHMHNRVTFSDGKFAYANMDGYERLIAFKTSPVADVAVGQVESSRLREQPKTPQEIAWQGRYARRYLDQPLVYQRTIVLVKQPAGAAGQDYYVIRDAWSGGPADLKGTYALHYLVAPEPNATVSPDAIKQNGTTFDCGNMTLFLAEPPSANPKAAYERFDWTYSKGKIGGKEGFGETTAGVRLTRPGASGSFVTVLYPAGAGKAPRMTAIGGEGPGAPDGVKVAFAGGVTDEITFSGPAHETVTLVRNGQSTVLMTDKDVNLDRSQGDIGLFVPEAGYDFGPIPEWLIRQRVTDRAATSPPAR